MSEKNENKNECRSKMPYQWPMNYCTYPMYDGMWQNMPRRCPCCGGILPMNYFNPCMGGYMCGETASFPESD